MARVPLYGDRRIEEAPNPATPLSGEIPSREAFGGGQSAAAAFGAVEEMVLKAKKEADETAVQDADNKAAEAYQQLLFDKDKGALNKKGLDAANLPDEVGEEYNKRLAEIEKSLNGTSQRGAFQRIKEQRGLQLRGALEKHSSAEIQAYKTGVFETGIKIAKEDAITNSSDPAMVEAAIKKQHEYLDKLAVMDGGIQGKLENLKLETSSKTYTAIMEKKINAFNEVGGVEETKAYFDSIKGNLTAADREAVSTALDKATLDYKGLSNSDKLFEKYKYSPTKVQEELMKIKDPAERKVTRDYFNQAMNDFKAFENFQQEQTMRSVYNHIKESKGDLKSLRPKIRGLDARDQDWFEKLAEDERNGKNRGYDKQLYYSIMEQIRTPEGLNKFKEEQLSKPEFISRLGSKWEEVVKLQQKQFDDDDLKGVRTRGQVIDQAFEEAGFGVPTKKDGAKKWEDYSKYREAVEDEIKRSGDDSLENINAISKRLTKERVLNKRLLFNVKEAPFKAKPEDVDLEDVGPELIEEMTFDFKQKTGREPSPVELQQMYIKALRAGLL